MDSIHWWNGHQERFEVQYVACKDALICSLEELVRPWQVQSVPSKHSSFQHHQHHVQPGLLTQDRLDSQTDAVDDAHCDVSCQYIKWFFFWLLMLCVLCFYCKLLKLAHFKWASLCLYEITYIYCPAVTWLADWITAWISRCMGASPWVHMSILLSCHFLLLTEDIICSH